MMHFTKDHEWVRVSGEIVAVNERVVSEPALVSSEQTGGGWLFKTKVCKAAERDTLLDEDAYDALNG